jgi:hypothetical protein
METFENSNPEFFSLFLPEVPFVVLEGRPKRDHIINEEDICDLKIFLAQGIGPVV